MHRLQQLIAGALACLVVSGLAAPAPAQEPGAAPTYQRMRTGADDWQARGGSFGHGHGRGGWGWGGGFFQPYISPVIASSWYARPYPYHFDYFRGRWGGGQDAYAGEAPRAADCPCANDVAPTLAAPEQP